jgi:hypothetical protein
VLLLHCPLHHHHPSFLALLQGLHLLGLLALAPLDLCHLELELLDLGLQAEQLLATGRAALSCYGLAGR